MSPARMTAPDAAAAAAAAADANKLVTARKPSQHRRSASPLRCDQPPH